MTLATIQPRYTSSLMAVPHNTSRATVLVTSHVLFLILAMLFFSFIFGFIFFKPVNFFETSLSFSNRFIFFETSSFFFSDLFIIKLSSTIKFSSLSGFFQIFFFNKDILQTNAVCSFDVKVTLSVKLAF